jgi:hypothetical protein
LRNRDRVAAGRLGWLRNAKETVIAETPASAASARSVGRAAGGLAGVFAGIDVLL